ncbi:hypothetical protein [Actinosynnema sp. ALI-1.44]|uniref:hypothetical protein n=1 Tax=Actinosynnema sp. ALI-1.44 TaxID=1933779 RepID=UPI001EDAC574|nr:hypothetical protein [Actinosynnema sp. ALI-1.44]
MTPTTTGRSNRTPCDQVIVLHSGGVPALFAYHDALEQHLNTRHEHRSDTQQL